MHARWVTNYYSCMYVLYMAVQLGVPVCNALLAFGQEKYDEVRVIDFI